MKLDNVIYDVDALTAALQEQLNLDSPTFKAMFPSDTATALVNGMSAYASMLQYLLCSTMANCYTDSAFSEAGIYQLARTLGNALHGNVSALVKVSITKKNFVGINTVIPAETQFEIDGKKFFNPSAIIIPANVETVDDISLIQGEMLEVNRISNGIINEKFYFSENFKANHNYITVKVNDVTWEVAESFLPYDKGYIVDSSMMNTVVLVTDPDGKSYIKVGNNQLATMPLSGSNIKIKYVSNDGADGNIPEKDKSGALLSSLVFMDNFGKQDNLQLEITTTTTAYGGFSKQSIETLRQSSPHIFASGHRAIRRQDYIAMLLNKCGYLTAAVWGEYEEADKVGAYDSLMMNMVYYTGIKSFETYPYFIVGDITDSTKFEGSLNSVRGFWGSFSLRIKNLKNSEGFVFVQDTGAEGLLFINKDHDDPRDSLLPDWIATMKNGYKAYLPSNYIVTAGLGYSINDELIVNGTNDEVTLRVENINEVGRITKIRLLKYTTDVDYTGQGPFSTRYTQYGSNLGSGFTLNLEFMSSYASTLITTNDDRSIVPPPTQLNPILNARSDSSTSTFYQSLWQPSLLQPVQIILNYGDIQKGIAGIKFQASALANGPFPGTVAMFGTNIEPMPSLDNVRNSENWDRLIDRTYLTNPHGNNNDSWTDWIATNSFKGKTGDDGLPDWNRYKYFVIEFYSCEETTAFVPLVTIGKIKILYEEEASLIYYDNNGLISMKFPTAGSPGPGGDEYGYLTQSLINTVEYPMYSYNVKLEGITRANGYRDGNILAYTFTNNAVKLPFIINVVNIDNGVFTTSLNGSTLLTGTEKVELPTPVSLDATPTYTAVFDNNGQIPLGSGGTGYKPSDIVSIDASNGELTAKVVTVNSFGEVLTVSWENNLSLVANYTGAFATTLVTSPGESTGTGLILDITSHMNSGWNGVPGQNATISISSSNNLQTEASFVGNRIDSQNINYLDQPIINQYNHFTTFLEFKQPEIVQVGITIHASLSTSASITSGIIIQNIKNNVRKLFDVTPDYIGKGLKLSDIYEAVTSTPNVEWCNVIAPLSNIDIPMHGLMIPVYIDVIEIIPAFK